MSSMEMFIVVVALTAALAGGIVLLSCLAGGRARLVKAFNLQLEIEARQRALEQKAAQDKKKREAAPPVAEATPQRAL